MVSSDEVTPGNNASSKGSDDINPAVVQVPRVQMIYE